MARTGERKIIKIAKAVFGFYVKEIRIVEDSDGHPVMTLFYNNGYKMQIMQTFPAERMMANKWLNQAYNVEIVNKGGKLISHKHFLTAKMVKMAILKTKALDMLKGAKGANLWA